MNHTAYDYGEARIDIDWDGIPKERVGPYGIVKPDILEFVHGPVHPQHIIQHHIIQWE